MTLQLATARKHYRLTVPDVRRQLLENYTRLLQHQPSHPHQPILLKPLADHALCQTMSGQQFQEDSDTPLTLRF